MNIWSFYDKATALIPFSLKEYSGKISVFYGVNDDPIKVGFDSLSGLPFDIDRTRGYPAMHARVENYDGAGYRTLAGWIQIVTNLYFDSHDKEKSIPETYVSMDVLPSFQELDVPFASYGNLPQLFDAPSLNLRTYAELRWTADTFLTTVPARSRNEEISWLVGFRWGYIENNIPNEKPVLLPLEVTDSDVWNKYLPFLREEYKAWNFKNA